MKAVALKSFRDKYTGTLYAPGQVLTIERERFTEIMEAIGDSYIAEIVDPDATPEPEKPDGGEIDSGKIATGAVQDSDLQDSAPEPEGGESTMTPEEPDNSNSPEQEDNGGTSEPESGSEMPPAADPAPPEPPKRKRVKKE